MGSVFGRDFELGVVETFVGTDDGPRALLIAGEPGIGKTTLWQEAVALARSRGSIVLVARPAESEARLAFAGLADMLTGVPEALFAALPTPQRVGLDAALLRAPSARMPERRVIAAGLLSLLRALAGDTNVVVAIDDLHWLDAPSAAACEFALRRLGDEPVRLVVSLRSGETERSQLLSIARELRLDRLDLGPLSVATLHRVLSQTVGRRFSRPTLVRIAQASGGNPLYAIEIARQLDSGRSGDGGMLVPESLQALVGTRVRGLPGRSRDALLRAAALVRPDTAVVDPEDLAPAEAAGLVRIDADCRIHFTHPLFASAVYAAAGHVRRQKAHRALANMARDPEERARHLALASDAPDEAVARKVVAAAQRARLRGAPDTAAELTELALNLVPPNSPVSQQLRLDLAEHLYLASDFERARTLLEDLCGVLELGHLRARALLTLSEIDYWRLGESAALALAEKALAAADGPLQQARCQTAVAMYAGTVDLSKAAAAARAAIGLLENQPDAEPTLVAAALGARVRADLFLGEGFDSEAAARALELEASALPAAVDGRVGFKLGQWLRYVDDFDGARTRLVEAERQAHDEGDDSSLANILLNRLILETWAGDWVEAAALTERMSDAFEQQGVTFAEINPWLAYVDAYAGRLISVRAASGSQPTEPIVAAIWNRCLGLAELATEELEAADRHLSDALAGLDEVDFREPAIWRVDGDAIEAAIATGSLERAERWLNRFEERAARSRVPWSLAVSARCRGLLLAAGGDLEPAAAALDRSLAEHDRCPMPFERARTLLIQGQVYRRLKQKRQARAALEDARAIFARLGADTWVTRADAELERVIVRRAPVALSTTERRIAELAAEGLSNPEIAAQAFVSRKTVEANLARAYRKLGITSRAQLDRALQRDAEIIS